MFPKRPAAFTMLEVLIVIGVIVLLAGIVLVGMRSITGGSKVQQTRLTLQNLRSMLAEYETVTRFSKGPPAWGWINQAGSMRVDVFAGTSMSGLAVDFWRAPFIVTDQETSPGPDPLDAPGNVSAGGDINDPTNPIRNGSRPIINTQLAMNYILSLESNRKMIQGLAGDRYFIPQWQAANLLAPGPDRVKYTSDDPTAETEPVFYYLGNRVLYDGQVYRCMQAHASPSGSPAPPGSPARWVPEGSAAEIIKSQPTVMLLDAWNNPILFVPASGLRVRMLNGESALMPSKMGQTVVIVSSEGSATLARMDNTAGLLRRAGKPFFVSAGPDGDFATGEDNVYSFEE